MRSAKPKVRARAISALKPSGVKVNCRLWWSISGWSKWIAQSISKRGGRLEPGALVLAAHRDRLQDLDPAPRPVLLDHAGALDQEHEGLRAAVHDRQLRPAQLDQGIVDLARREGRHQMLDRGDRRAARPAQLGAHGGVADLVVARRHRRTVRLIVAHEPDAAVGLGGTQRQRDLGTGVQAGTDTADRVAQGTLRTAGEARPTTDQASAPFAPRPLPTPAPARAPEIGATNRPRG